MGYGHKLLFATMIGFGMLIPLIGAQLFLLFLIHYMVSLGDIKSAVISMVIVYPLLSEWIDLYCHRSVHGGGGFHYQAGAYVTSRSPAPASILNSWACRQETRSPGKISGEIPQGRSGSGRDA